MSVVEPIIEEDCSGHIGNLQYNSREREQQTDK